MGFSVIYESIKQITGSKPKKDKIDLQCTTDLIAFTSKSAQKSSNLETFDQLNLGRKFSLAGQAIKTNCPINYPGHFTMFSIKIKGKTRFLNPSELFRLSKTTGEICRY